MLISEVSERTRLTKKAIEYYTLQGLVTPAVLDNGYRAYSGRDVDALHKIGVLRRLDISIEEIRRILSDTTNAALQAVSIKKELELQRDMLKRSILQRLIEGASCEEIDAGLRAVEQGKSITDRLLDAFPGYYGRFICMHFARFLIEPARTEAQRAAYETILSFLDSVSLADIPEELKAYLDEGTAQIGTPQILQMLESTQKAYENPDKFFADNREALAQYAAFKQSEEYQASPACKCLGLMRAFNRSIGYEEIFIPAMRQLSPAYAEYRRQLEAANDALLARFPEIEAPGKPRA